MQEPDEMMRTIAVDPGEVAVPSPAEVMGLDHAIAQTSELEQFRSRATLRGIADLPDEQLLEYAGRSLRKQVGGPNRQQRREADRRARKAQVETQQAAARRAQAEAKRARRRQARDDPADGRWSRHEPEVVIGPDLDPADAPTEEVA